MRLYSSSLPAVLGLSVCRDLKELLAKASLVLSSKERESLSRITDLHRRDQSLAARVFLKLLLQKIFQFEPLDLRIERRSTGSLVVRGLKGRVHVSISHSANAVAAVVARSDVGIDLEGDRLLQNEKSLRLRICRDEAERALGLSTLGLWALKEAVVKVMGDGLVSDVRILSAVRVKRGRIQVSARRGRKCFQGELWRLSGGHWLAVIQKR